MKQRVVVVAGGVVSQDFLHTKIKSDDLVIGADSGVVSLLDAGVTPSFAVGDFDTAGVSRIDEWKALGIEVLALPTAKDVTDAHAALEHALTFAPAEILLLGGLGGARMDHTLANIALLEWLAGEGVEGILQDETNCIRLLIGPGIMKVVNDGFTYLSLLPISKTVEGVTTTGLVYPLHREQLERGDTRGISNEIKEASASISISAGVCLIIQSKDEDRD